MNGAHIAVDQDPNLLEAGREAGCEASAKSHATALHIGFLSFLTTVVSSFYLITTKVVDRL